MELGDMRRILVVLACLLLVQGVVAAGDLVPFGADWRYFKGTEAPSAPADAWKEMDFNDLTWDVNEAGFGYGDDDDATVLGDMRGNYISVFIRTEFTVDSINAGDDIELAIYYDDGFVAYLNGKEIDRRHMPSGDVTFETEAGSHDADNVVVIPMGKASEWLVAGRNVLAVQGHNVTLGNSSDFSLHPSLRTVTGPVTVEITEDTTWSGSYLNEGSVIVREGATLTIEAGTTVLMTNRADIIVEGRLLALGTRDDQIVFTRQSAGVLWKQIKFVGAEDSVLRHCVIEFADCEGEHKVYYPDWGHSECDANRAPDSRDYNEAVVAVACHVDIESCLFHNLPDEGTGEGDAVAIISDDPDYPGDATAHITDCQFISIGAGVHTRYSHVIVERCFFTDHHGDNDDIDLYGESTPPTLILNNIMLSPAYDDAMNPTRCSAIMIGNIIGDTSDHGVVLRDKCYPIMINNTIYRCPNGGIAIQNQCDALLINNTIVDCGKGVRFFDHTGRWGPEYCLNPGSGKATVINCIIWDCAETFELANSPWSGDPGSHVTVSYCDIQGGQSRIDKSSNSTVTWGLGNIDVDPLFADEAGNDYHLQSEYGRWDPEAGQWVKDAATSLCIDAGVSGDANNPYMAEPIAYGWRGELWPHGRATNLGAFGGTAEASMSQLQLGSASDVAGDGAVSWPDVALIVQKWLTEKVPQLADVNRDGIVDFEDFSLMGLDWDSLGD